MYERRRKTPRPPSEAAAAAAAVHVREKGRRASEGLFSSLFLSPLQSVYIVGLLLMPKGGKSRTQAEMASQSLSLFYSPFYSLPLFRQKGTYTHTYVRTCVARPSFLLAVHERTPISPGSKSDLHPLIIHPRNPSRVEWGRGGDDVAYCRRLEKNWRMN